MTVTGVISGAGDLTKLGQGILALNAANTYTGNTNVGTTLLNGGILQVLNNAGLGARRW